MEQQPQGAPPRPQSPVDQQPPRPPQPAENAPGDWGRIGGGLLAFIVLQAIQTFVLLSDLPSALEGALEGVMAPGRAGVVGMAEAACDWVTLVTLVAYAAVIIVALVQLIQRHPAFLRNFQIAGVAAIAGNLVVFLLMEAVHVYYTTNPGALGDGTAYGYSWQAGTHWTFVVLALMWTIFWTLYFARSVRMRHYMSPDNPYTTANGLPYMERALFGRGMRG